MIEKNPIEKGNKVNAEEIAEKLSNSGFGWISKENLLKIISIVTESVDQTKKG